MQPHSGDDRGHHVEKLRWQAFTEWILAFLLPARDQIHVLERLQKIRNFVGIVLQVAVHGHDHLTTGFLKSCRQSGCFAVVSAKTNGPYPRIVLVCQVGDCVERTIRAAVVYEDYFRRDRET